MSGILQNLDLVASQFEVDWGVGKLRLAVSKDLQQRFDAQQQKLDAAIESGIETRINKHAAAMIRAWRALDAYARGEGIRPENESVWLVKHPGTDKKVVVYSDNASIAYLPEDLPALNIDEILKFVPDEVVEIKKVFKGAKVRKVTAPAEFYDDEIPF